jgi:hypothetical protein
MIEELRKLWKKLLKAEAKHKTKKAQKIERKIILLELELYGS